MAQDEAGPGTRLGWLAAGSARLGELPGSGIDPAVESQ
jgi:hypothetical protein